MKTKTLILLLASLSLFNSYSQESEEYVDGRLIKTQSKKGFVVSTSLRAIQRNDGKYYTFDVSISNSSQNTLNVKINDFKAQVVSKKGKRWDLEVLSNKEYQKIKKRRASQKAQYRLSFRQRSGTGYSNDVIELNIVIQGIQFVFKWDPEDSQN